MCAIPAIPFLQHPPAVTMLELCFSGKCGASVTPGVGDMQWYSFHLQNECKAQMTHPGSLRVHF